MRQTSLGILTVATNRIYVDFWASMVESIGQKFGSGVSVTLHVFTDLPESVAESADAIQALGLEIEIHTIDSMGWPDATRRRYEIFDSHRQFLTQDILMHLDADMVFRSRFLPRLLKLARRRGLVFVRHPGYYRPIFSWRTLAYYMKDFNRLRSDLGMIQSRGGLGDWDNQPHSRAYVAKRDRRSYVCGGCWYGSRDWMLRLLRELADDVSIDHLAGIEAKWHDESYLNRFYSRNNFPVVSPALCFDARLPYLAGIKPIIEAVDKGNQKIR